MLGDLNLRGVTGPTELATAAAVLVHTSFGRCGLAAKAPPVWSLPSPSPAPAPMPAQPAALSPTGPPARSRAAAPRPPPRPAARRLSAPLAAQFPPLSTPRQPIVVFPTVSIVAHPHPPINHPPLSCLLSVPYGHSSSASAGMHIACCGPVTHAAPTWPNSTGVALPVGAL